MNNTIINANFSYTIESCFLASHLAMANSQQRGQALELSTGNLHY